MPRLIGLVLFALPLAAGRADDRPASPARPPTYSTWMDLDAKFQSADNQSVSVKVEWVVPAQVQQFRRVAPTFGPTGRRTGRVGSTRTRVTKAKEMDEEHTFKLLRDAAVRWELPPTVRDAAGRAAPLKHQDQLALRSEWLKLPGYAARPDDLSADLPVRVRLVLPHGLPLDRAGLDDVRAKTLTITGKQPPVSPATLAELLAAVPKKR